MKSDICMLSVITIIAGLSAHRADASETTDAMLTELKVNAAQPFTEEAGI